MGNIWVKEFTGGLDARRLPEATAGGVLIRARNGHITRGGEFEKRKAFALAYSLPAGTVGLAPGKTNLYVFGSGNAPAGLPSGVLYQQLQHSNGTTALVRILSTDLYAGKLYVVGEFLDGSIFHFYDGVRVTDWYDGRARASITVQSGVATPSASTVATLKVDGVSIISGPVSWTTGEVQFAADLAAAVNSYTSSPDYIATSNGPVVTIVAATAGATSNDKLVSVTVTNSLALSTTSIKLAGGSDQAASYVPGTFVKTIGKKVYSTSGSTLHFSGIAQPTKWKTDAVGAGFIDMSSETSGSEELVAVAKYQNNIAVFAERVVQIWYVDPDPTLNRQSQILNNTGTISGKSVTQFSDNDLFYLDESGLRSLRARDASNSAATNDVGVLIDPLIIAKLATMSAADRRGIVGLIEPSDGRFWLVMKDVIFVYSFYPGAKVSAWTTYELSTSTSSGIDTPVAVDAMTTFNRRVFVRSGDQIFAYGGLTGDVYDATQAEAWTPLLDAGTPTREKDIEGVDAALTGEWAISVAMQPTDPTAEDLIATVYETTYNSARIPATGRSTHFSLRGRTRYVGPATLSSIIVHYTPDADEDK